MKYQIVRIKKIIEPKLIYYPQELINEAADSLLDLQVIPVVLLRTNIEEYQLINNQLIYQAAKHAKLRLISSFVCENMEEVKLVLNQLQIFTKT